MSHHATLSISTLSTTKTFQQDWFTSIIERNPSLNFTEFIDMLGAAVSIAKYYDSPEHCTARYAMSLFNLIFPSDIWTLAPQWITCNGMIPDLAMETLTRYENKATFYRKVLVEFKKAKEDYVKNVREATVQLKDSLTLEFGPGYRSKGLAMVVCGSCWLFFEYNLVLSGRTQWGQDVAKVLLYPLTAKMNRVDRGDEGDEFPDIDPSYTEKFDGSNLDRYIMTMESNFDTICDILTWISRTRGDLVRTFTRSDLVSADSASELKVSRTERKERINKQKEETIQDLADATNTLLERMERHERVYGHTVSEDAMEE